MGREIRMVPPNWVHPRDEHGHDVSMADQSYDDAFAEWLTDFDRIRSGDLTELDRKGYAEPGMNPLVE